jgi:dihydropteroate synthase
MKPQSKIFSPNKTLNLNGRLMDLSVPKVMGIINLTPDSFYEGSRVEAKSVMLLVENMIKEGAEFIDIGGYSTRPGAADIPVEEELRRTIPVIKEIHFNFSDANISIDTFRSEVAKQAVEAGACMVNDVSGGSLDDKMFETVGKLGVPYVLMHTRGTPQTMKQLTEYDNLLKDLTDYFHKKIWEARQVGVKDIILDVGFGFAKTIDQNFELLNHLDRFKVFELPILAGLSRKSMIWKTLGITADEALNGTTVLNSIALMKGASILRVHDVKEAVECAKVFGKLSKGFPPLDLNRVC